MERDALSGGASRSLATSTTINRGARTAQEPLMARMFAASFHTTAIHGVGNTAEAAAADAWRTVGGCRNSPGCEADGHCECDQPEIHRITRAALGAYNYGPPVYVERVQCWMTERAAARLGKVRLCVWCREADGVDRVASGVNVFNEDVCPRHSEGGY